MDDIVAHREDPILNSRSAIVRDALDLYKHFWKSRQVFTSSRYFTEYELAKKTASIRRDKEFTEQLNEMLRDAQRDESRENIQFVRDLATERRRQSDDQKMKRELERIIVSAESFLSNMVR